MTLLQALKQNFTSISHYEETIQKPISFSFRVFLLFFIIFGIISSIIFSIKSIPLAKNSTEIFLQKISSIYPQSLEINIKDGVVSTNMSESYFLPSDVLKDIFSEDIAQTISMGKTNLVTIDTKAKIEDFNNYDSLFLLTRSHISYLNQNGAIQSTSLDSIKNFYINKQKIEKDAIESARWVSLKIITPLIFTLAFIYFSILMPIGKILYLIIFSLMGIILARITGIKLSYKQSYQMNMHLVLITTAIFSTINIFMMDIQTLPFIQTILLSSMMMWAVSFFKPETKVLSPLENKD